jgi:hypothetical protein
MHGKHERRCHERGLAFQECGLMASRFAVS